MAGLEWLPYIHRLSRWLRHSQWPYLGDVGSTIPSVAPQRLWLLWRVMTTIEDERVCTELSMTLGVSFRIKCVVAAPHATWPRGACWSVGLIAWPLGFLLFFSFLGLVFKLSSPSHFPISLIICFEFFFSPPFTLAIVPTLFLRYPLDFSPIELLSDCAAYFQGMFFFPSPFISFFLHILL